MTKGRLLMLMDRFPNYSEGFILRELEALHRLGYQIKVLASGKVDSDWANEYLDACPYEVSFCPTGLSGRIIGAHLYWFFRRPAKWLAALKSPGTLSRAVWFARHAGPGHLHAQFASKPARIAQLIHRFTSRPFSFSAHARDIYVEGGDLASLIRDARFVDTCTAYNREYLSGIAPAEKDKIHCIYHGLERETWKAGSQSGDQRNKQILAVGRLVEKKGFDLLVRAISQASLEGWTCKIVGDGPEKGRLAAMIEEMGVGDRVELAGALAPEQVRNAYQEAGLLVQPCRIAADGDRDGLPNVLLEAAASGLPILATEISAIPELVVHDESGWLFPSGDEQALVAALEHLSREPELRERLAGKAQERVWIQFDREEQVRHWDELFMEHKISLS